MKKMNLVLCLLCAAMVVFAGGEQEKATGEARVLPNMEGMRIVDTPVTLSALVAVDPDQPNPDQLPFMKYIQEQTGVDFEWNVVQGSTADYVQKVNLVFAAGDLPDVVYSIIPDRGFVMKQASVGNLVPMNDLIENYTVNLKDFLIQRPDIRRELTTPDGNIYNLFTLVEMEHRLYNDPYFINKAWLDRLGLSMPTTTEELRKVLTAFKNEDANGNGDPNDELPFSWRETGWAGQRIDGFFGSWGVTDNKDQNHLAVKNGKVFLSALAPGYRKGLEYLNGLYKAGLIDPEAFTQNMTQLKAKAGADQIGMLVFYWPHNVFGNEGMKDMAFVPPLKGPDGTIMAQQAGMVTGFEGPRFMITKDNPYPEVTIRYADILMDGGEMTLNASYGMKGKFWEGDPDVEWTLNADLIPDGLGEVQHRNAITLRNQINIRDKDLYSRFIPDPLFAQRTEWLRQAQPYFADEILPNFWFTPEESNEIQTISSELNNYADEMRAKFIIDGVTDASWSTYEKNMGKIGYQRMIEIYQNAYDSYLSK